MRPPKTARALLGPAIFLVAYLGLKYLFPGVARPWQVAFYGALLAVILIVAVRQIRRHLWLNVFLSVAAIVTIILPWVFDPQPNSSSAGTALRFPVAWFVLFLVPRGSRVPRNEFLMCASILTLAFAVNTGLLGSGIFSTLVGIGLLVAISARTLVHDRRYGLTATEPWPAPK